MGKSKIGRLFKKDHATVIHGLKTFSHLYETEPFFKLKYNVILTEYQETIGDLDDDFESLHIENTILKKRIEKDGYIEAKIKEMFLENQCRLTFQLVPDKDFDRKQKAKFDELLKEKTKSPKKIENL